MSLRVGILTGNDTRHRYFVNAVDSHHKVVAVGYQTIDYVAADTGGDGLDERTTKAVGEHFAERRRQEKAFFGHSAAMREDGASCGIGHLTRESLSSEETTEFLVERAVDVVLIFGTDLIQPPLLERFAGRLINMHLGLSPYYRGTATNFYPLLNEEPEYVGATIHFIDAGIDSGEIVHHARPEITADDRPHTVGCKAILAGIEKMIQTLDEFEADSVAPVSQWPAARSRLYLRKDYHPSQVVRLYELIDDGLFDKYVARKNRVQDAFQLIR